ncbi:MAG: RNA polymerase sigma factor [Clostridiales bacterium]|nr:RNA polymerase sigma factor [Clostridiales bacterium]
MAKSLHRTYEEVAGLYERHVQTIYRVCFAYMKNAADTEDMVQETFVRLINKCGAFENEEHEKAWLIRTAANLCKDGLRHWWSRREGLEYLDNLQFEDTRNRQKIKTDEVFEAIMELPGKFKTVIYLYYYEGYSSVEIAEKLQKPQSTVRTHLQGARELLRKKLGGDFNAEEQTNHRILEQSRG